jgi:hypothetical protein
MREFTSVCLLVTFCPWVYDLVMEVKSKARESDVQYFGKNQSVIHLFYFSNIETMCLLLYLQLSPYPNFCYPLCVCMHVCVCLSLCLCMCKCLCSIWMLSWLELTWEVFLSSSHCKDDSPVMNLTEKTPHYTIMTYFIKFLHNLWYHCPGKQLSAHSW